MIGYIALFALTALVLGETTEYPPAYKNTIAKNVGLPGNEYSTVNLSDYLNYGPSSTISIDSNEEYSSYPIDESSSYSSRIYSTVNDWANSSSIETNSYSTDTYVLSIGTTMNYRYSYPSSACNALTTETIYIEASETVVVTETTTTTVECEGTTTTVAVDGSGGWIEGNGSQGAMTTTVNRDTYTLTYTYTDATTTYTTIYTTEVYDTGYTAKYQNSTSGSNSRIGSSSSEYIESFMYDPYTTELSEYTTSIYYPTTSSEPEESSSMWVDSLASDYVYPSSSGYYPSVSDSEPESLSTAPYSAYYYKGSTIYY
ncbi:uncharacterized protein SPAPADRAFT_66712 [Spathaspora passalidarum NRRL Y-27907]|uniref:Uncharacterized protein n=1 Tax=Spathaspora passalidarum (strain NRRL Y-27907 / 11-Y1) TaxID=619300 RepID=G3AP15_SPAPN|nr:uncharacterized protein SPAPADRAFT_66712 [Spathaspora passalidarum NRRL Y-27907]EGW32046.1 hypothetical protein SPAPADRAFT_66712 [Spathaspora passalidarum NRRL Y-27907]